MASYVWMTEIFSNDMLLDYLKQQFKKLFLPFKISISKLYNSKLSCTFFFVLTGIIIHYFLASLKEHHYERNLNDCRHIVRYILLLCTEE